MFPASHWREARFNKDLSAAAPKAMKTPLFIRTADSLLTKLLQGFALKQKSWDSDGDGHRARRVARDHPVEERNRLALSRASIYAFGAEES